MLPGDFAVWFNSSLSPGPCHLRALCAVALKLGKGHCHCHPLMAKKSAEASLFPAAGTSCAAACIATLSHGPTVKVRTKLVTEKQRKPV